MGFFRKMFGAGPQAQKERKFAELDRIFCRSPEIARTMKARWLTSRGNYYGENNQFQFASEDFKEAILIKPDYFPAYLGLSLIFSYNGLAENNLQDLELAIGILHKLPPQVSIGDKIFNKDDIPAIHFHLAALYIVLVKIGIDCAAEAKKYCTLALNSHNRMSGVIENDPDLVLFLRLEEDQLSSLNDFLGLKIKNNSTAFDGKLKLNELMSEVGQHKLRNAAKTQDDENTAPLHVSQQDSAFRVTVDPKKCVGDEACLEACPVGVFKIHDGKAVPVHVEECMGCESCIVACENDAITLEEV